MNEELEQLNTSSEQPEVAVQPVAPQEAAEGNGCNQASATKKPLRDFADSGFEEREVVTPKRKNRWLGNVFFVAVIVLSFMLMYQLSRNAANGNEKTLLEILQNLRAEYLCLAVATLLGMMLIDSLKYLVIMHATVRKANYGTALKTALLGKYYDFITPFSSGGQPFQIHYLHKKGLTGGESTAVIFIKYCFNMLMWLTICFCLMVFNRGALDKYVTNISQRTLFAVFGWIGFVVNCSLPILIIAFALFPKMMEALSRWVLTVGHKLKLVKSKEVVVIKAKRISKDFRSVFSIMIRRPLHTLALVVCCIAEPLLGMMLPYFVVVAMTGNSIVPSYELMLAIMTLNVYVSMSVTIIPTPGNSGAMENAFLLTLTSVAEGVLFWTVFTWRFLSYYVYLIVGLIMVITDFVRRQRSARCQ